MQLHLETEYANYFRVEFILTLKKRMTCRSKSIAKHNKDGLVKVLVKCYADRVLEVFILSI